MTMADDRICDLGTSCRCVTRGARDDGFHFDQKKREGCEHFHMPCPAIVQSKQDRLRVTRGAWDKKRDTMMREAEKRLDKLKPQAEIEEKLRETRHNPVKHLERKGVRKMGREAR